MTLSTKGKLLQRGSTVAYYLLFYCSIIWTLSARQPLYIVQRDPIGQICCHATAYKSDLQIYIPIYSKGCYRNHSVSKSLHSHAQLCTVIAQLCTVMHSSSTALHSYAQSMHSFAQSCTALHSHAQLCTVMHSFAQSCTALHSHAQFLHSHAQLCTVCCYAVVPAWLLTVSKSHGVKWLISGGSLVTWPCDHSCDTVTWPLLPRVLMVNHFNYVHRSLTPSFIRKQTLCVTTPSWLQTIHAYTESLLHAAQHSAKTLYHIKPLVKTILCPSTNSLD